jgi:hypothetical protein
VIGPPLFHGDTLAPIRQPGCLVPFRPGRQARRRLRWTCSGQTREGMHPPPVPSTSTGRGASPPPPSSAELVRVTYCTDPAGWDEPQFGRPSGPFCPVMAGFEGAAGPPRGGVAVGVGWVYCFLSRREGDQRECWEPEAANPLKFSRPGSGWRFVRCGFGWGWFGCWCGSWKRDLHWGLEPGKFEKLLRSDPRLRLWWCRVCLLFENSIVCQVC